MSVPRWVETVPQRNIPLPPADYYECFRDALKKMSTFLYKSNDRLFELHSIERDEQISDDEAAWDHFYSNFSLSRRRGKTVIEYFLSQAFFTYSYNGLYLPPLRLKRQEESHTDFIRDCATNYLLKNFWHNYVHERGQRITGSNYRLFQHESRYYSDFEADNIANILLPLSYSRKIAACQSDLSATRTDINNLLERNRCNNVFSIRAKARRDFPAPNQSYDSLQDWEWRIRRRFTNLLSQRLIQNDRAVSSITFHFFGEIIVDQNRFERPNAGASIEVNGIRIPFENLGNLGLLTEDQIKESTIDYVTRADVEYSSRLREDQLLGRYALDSLRAKCDFLVGWSTNDIILETFQNTA